jgi:hypothetical protein
MPVPQWGDPGLRVSQFCIRGSRILDDPEDRHLPTINPLGTVQFNVNVHYQPSPSKMTVRESLPIAHRLFIASKASIRLVVELDR